MKTCLILVNELMILQIDFSARLETLQNKQPEHIERILLKEELVSDKADSFELKRFKNSKKIKSKLGITAKLKIPYKAITIYHFNNTSIANLHKFQNKLGVVSFTLEQEFRTQLLEMFSFIDALAFSKFDYEVEVNKRFAGLNKLVDDQFKLFV